MLKQLRQNKRGITLVSITEMMIIILLFIVIAGSFITSMNDYYGEDNLLPLGDLVNDTSASLSAYQDQSRNETGLGGKIEDTGSGFQLKTAWNLGFALLNIMWTFGTGGWITTILNSVFPGSSVIVNLISPLIRMFYTIGLILAVLAVFFGRKP